MMENYYQTDPEFMERFAHFAFDEVVNEPGQELEPVTRHMAILATLLGCQGLDAFRELLPRRALEAGLTPVMVKEIGLPVCGLPGHRPGAAPSCRPPTNCLTQQGVSLPLEGQATTTMENRLEKGAQAQGGHLRGPDVGGLESRPYQPLAGGQLLWRLLHPHRPHPGPAGNDHLLLFGGPGRL